MGETKPNCRGLAPPYVRSEGDGCAASQAFAGVCVTSAGKAPMKADTILSSCSGDALPHRTPPSLEAPRGAPSSNSLHGSSDLCPCPVSGAAKLIIMILFV